MATPLLKQILKFGILVAFLAKPVMAQTAPGNPGHEVNGGIKFTPLEIKGTELRPNGSRADFKLKLGGVNPENTSLTDAKPFLENWLLSMGAYRVGKNHFAIGAEFNGEMDFKDLKFGLGVNDKNPKTMSFTSVMFYPYKAHFEGQGPVSFSNGAGISIEGLQEISALAGVLSGYAKIDLDVLYKDPDQITYLVKSTDDPSKKPGYNAQAEGGLLLSIGRRNRAGQRPLSVGAGVVYQVAKIGDLGHERVMPELKMVFRPFSGPTSTTANH